MKLEVVSGQAITPFIPELARLRIQVFREFPYLYDGDLDYETHYLKKFTDLPTATLVVARDGARVVGASTALPLGAAEPEIQAPFLLRGLEHGLEHDLGVADWYYFGESVLERAYRGHGLGVQFFQFRESRARKLGYTHATFCAVIRAEDHPARPADYAPLDAFWTRRGYVKRPELACGFSWKDVGEATETVKQMMFWTKKLE
jgi:GNAT superfamily N-acetyltransferase